jgi:serine/threonine protein kinase
VFDIAALKKHKTMARVAGRVSVSSAWDKVAAEVAIMRTLDHAHVVKLDAAFGDDRRYFMVLEFCALGPVMTYDAESRAFACAVGGGAVARARAARYVGEIAAGLAHCHARHVAHRDVKPDNVLLSAAHACKLADFGVAHAFGDTVGG